MAGWPNLQGPAGNASQPATARSRGDGTRLYPAGGTAGAAATRGRMYCPTALAKPSSSLEAVTK